MTTQPHGSWQTPPTFSYNGFNASSRGVSTEAAYIDAGFRRVADSQASTFMVLSRENQMLDSLIEAIEGAMEEDWDGYGAEMASPESIRFAVQIVQLVSTLPFHLSLPSIAIEPDGEVAFTWQTAADRIFSVSVGEFGRLAFSGRVGTREVEGSIFFVSTLPPPILREVYAVG